MVFFKLPFEKLIIYMLYIFNSFRRAGRLPALQAGTAGSH